MTSKDPYKYFRIEARELSDALKHGVLALEREGASKETVAQLLRNAHTLKGASRVVGLVAIADLAHAMEEALAPLREGNAPLSPELLKKLLDQLDEMTLLLSRLDAPVDAEAAKETDPVAEKRPVPHRTTVRLEVGEVDALLRNLSELASEFSLLRRETSLDHLRALAQELTESRSDDMTAKELSSGLDRLHRVASAILERAERNLAESHQKADRLRLKQASSLFDFLERAARDAARSLGKKIRFETDGGDHRLDAPVLSALQDALLHVVRNAVAHGLEENEERLRAGKPPEGLLRIEVERHGGEMTFRCRDDGKGVDLAAIRRVAVAKGLIPPSAPDPLSMEEAARLLLSGGITTSSEVTGVSGRGVGLDVLRETAELLQGGVRIQSEPGRGTIVEIRVPYSMSIFKALAVEAEGITALLPFDGVRRVLQVEEKNIARSPQGDSIEFEGTFLPLMALNRYFSTSSAKPQRVHSIVVVKSGTELAALGVDRLLGVREITARPLPELSAGDDILAGSSLDGEGNPCLILNLEGLVIAAGAHPGEGPVLEPPPRPVILVVDDSLTTRMLEKTILETAGYEVETAVSAEDALIMAGRRRYGLFLVDVEMPGLDGFQLLEIFKGNTDLRDIPAILVTSRVSPEDRRRGESVGARDHINKGEFNQPRLLARIKELAG